MENNMEASFKAVNVHLRTLGKSVGAVKSSTKRFDLPKLPALQEATVAYGKNL